MAHIKTTAVVNTTVTGTSQSGGSVTGTGVGDSLMTMKEELFGQDIQVDGDLDAALSASGEMIVTTGTRAFIQDIKARV